MVGFLKPEIESGDALLIVPPCASSVMPSLAAHILQACAARHNHRVRVLYSNFYFAAQIGEINYEALCRSSIEYMLGDRMFCAAAYDVKPFGSDDFLNKLDAVNLKIDNNNINVDLSISDLMVWEKATVEWADVLSRAIVEKNFRVVGCTTTFEQTAGAVALLNRIKLLSPDTITVIGGANCEGEMAHGILSLDSGIDYVFSGQSENTFPKFLTNLARDERPEYPIIVGDPWVNLEEIPTPDFTAFFEQRKGILPNGIFEDNLWLTYESSRGCWWGEKHHCTFCGLNGETMAFRHKSADRVLADVKALLKNSPTKQICMTDNIIPHEYFRTLLPRVSKEIPEVTFFYEVKANLPLHRVVAMKEGGVSWAQPGIESISDRCLKLMKKGVSSIQNLHLLRYAKSVGVKLEWNILFALPGDKLEDYQKMLEILPYLRHLQPPLGLSHLSLERFSPYFRDREAYGIENMRPIPPYHAIFPDHADVEKLAYHFNGDYKSESKENPKLMRQLQAEVDNWIHAWSSEDEIPALRVAEVNTGIYLLIDTRGLQEGKELYFLNEPRLRLILSGETDSNEDLEWALERKFVIELDGRLAPLATASPKFFQRIMDETKREKLARQRRRKSTQKVEAESGHGFLCQ